MQQLNEIQAQLEQQNTPKAEQASSGTSISLDGSLRPTFAVTSTDAENTADIGDARSASALGWRTS